MPKTLLLVGTRKGLFALESDDRRDWSVRGPSCSSNRKDAKSRKPRSCASASTLPSRFSFTSPARTS